MNQQRRFVLRQGGNLTVLGLAIAAGIIRPSFVWAAEDWNAPAFDAKSLADTVKALGGLAPVPSKDILLTVPDIAENGAVVPVGVSSTLAHVQDIGILVEKNPNMLSALFTIPQGTEPTILTRVKMSQTSDVYALVKADGQYYFAKKEVKVTLGGCGG